MAEQIKRVEMIPQQKTINMIEKLLHERKIDPAQVKDKERNLWYLSQDSTKFCLELFQLDKGPEAGCVDCIEISLMVIHLTEDDYRPALLQRLLEFNAQFVGVYYAVRDDRILLLSTRELASVDYCELKTMVDNVFYYSEFWNTFCRMIYGGVDMETQG